MIKTEEQATYLVPSISPSTPAQEEERILARAREILHARLMRTPFPPPLTSPQSAKDFLVHQLAEREHEIFAVIWMDNKHVPLQYQELFRGTVDGASVHPREVVKEALKLNAVACILVHNHPSGNPEPSQADLRITQKLKQALELVKIRVLDHLIVGGTEIVSFADRGLIQ